MNAADQPLTHRQVLVLFSGLMLGMLLASLDHTILATALPRIVGDLGGLDHLSWVVTAYMLATTVSAPLYGKLGDLLGRKRLFQVAIAIFLVGSVLCGLSQSLTQLVAFRSVQGIGGGGLLVLTHAMVADVVPPRDRGRYQGYFSAMYALASVIGPLVGGFFTDHASWRWVFYVNVPLGIVALAVTSAVLPRGVRRAEVHLDIPGAVLLTAGASAVVLLTTWGGTEFAWSSPVVVGLGVAALAALAGFLWAERRAIEPVLPLRLFASRTFAASCAMCLLVGFAMFGTISFMPMFLQVVTGASATSSGLLLLPIMAGVTTSSVLTGRFVSRTGRYKVVPVCGTALAACGMALLSTLSAATPRVVGAAYMMMIGAGIGSVLQVLIVAAQNAVSQRDLGVATSSINFFRNIGGALGVAMFGAVFSSRFAATVPQNPLEGQLSIEAIDALPAALRTDVVAGVDVALGTVFACAVPVLLVAFALAVTLREVPLRKSPRRAEEAPSEAVAAGAV